MLIAALAKMFSKLGVKKNQRDHTCAPVRKLHVAKMDTWNTAADLSGAFPELDAQVNARLTTIVSRQRISNAPRKWSRFGVRTCPIGAWLGVSSGRTRLMMIDHVKHMDLVNWLPPTDVFKDISL